MTAAVLDAVRRVEYVLILANSDAKGRRPDPPEPIRRPGAKAPHRTTALTQATAEWLFDMTRERPS